MSSPPERSVGAVILAAGESRRLGQPKQLVLHEGKTLLERTMEAATTAGADPVVVVLGASAELIRRKVSVKADRVRLVENVDWSLGMGSSIARGVHALLEADPETGAAMILVCDQPGLDAGILQEFLRDSSKHPGAILVAEYGSGRGPPVVFPRGYFEELLMLHNDTGARDVYRRHGEVVRLISFPGGAIDIDTPGDLGGRKSS